MRFASTVAVASLAAWLLCGCHSKPLGGSEDEADDLFGNFSSQLPPDKPLDALTEKEAQQLCNEVAAYGEAVWDLTLELACRYSSVIIAGSLQPASDDEAQEACLNERAECLALPVPSPDSCPDTASCAATISQLQQCMNANAALTRDRASSVPPCEDLTLDDLIPASTTRPEECVQFYAMCPDF